MTYYLDEYCDKAEKCGLWEGCVTPDMSPDVSAMYGQCDVMLIGEAPGKHEDEQGKPFVGAAGQFLRELVSDSGMSAYNIVYTNVVRCRPPDNKTPSKKHISYCMPKVLAEILHYTPRLIILLGNVPLNIVGESGITNWHGVFLEKDGHTYMPAYHPSYIKRGNYELLPEMVADFDNAVQWLDGNYKQSNIASEYTVYLVSTAEDADYMRSTLSQARHISFDTESSTGIKPYNDGTFPFLFSFAQKEPTKYAWVVQLNEQTIDACADILGNDKIGKCLHNAKYDMLVVKAIGGEDVQGLQNDSMLLSSIKDGALGGHGLKELAGRYLGMYGYDEDLILYQAQHPESNPKKKRKGVRGDMSLVPIDIVAPYTACDAIATLELPDKLLPVLDGEQIPAYELSLAATKMLLHIEHNGAKLDLDVVDDYTKMYTEEQLVQLALIRDDEVTQQFERYTEQAYKGTNYQKAQLLFGRRLHSDEPNIMRFQRDNKWLKCTSAVKKLYERPSGKTVPIGFGLQPVAYTDSGMPTTKWKVIKDAASKLSIGTALRYHNLLGMMLSRYLLPAREWLGADGRARCTYNQHNVVTGRLSSSGPNLQNIPTPEKEPGTILERHPIKNIFTYSFGDLQWRMQHFLGLTDKALSEAQLQDHYEFMEHVAEGHCGCVMTADYANMELRVMAAVSNCQGLKYIFDTGVDPHSMVAEMLYGVKQSDYPASEWKAMRYRAKWVNWTLLFGGSWRTLMLTYGIPESEARWIEATYYKRFPEVLVFKQEQIAFAQQHGYVQSVYGRRRYLPYINDKEKHNEAEREAVNMPIQSAASDTLLIALCIIDYMMEQENCKSLMVNTVHDSVMFDVYMGELDNLCALTKEVMVNVKDYAGMLFNTIDMSWLTVPLGADIEVGHHYGSIKSYGE